MLFREKVFEIVKQIPKGKTLSYKEVAKRAGNPKAARAVGRILNSNKDLVNIPCFRVVRSNGAVGGYKLGIKKKIKLLKAEKAYI